MDLSLVPMEDIIKEINNRHTAFVLAVLRNEEGNHPIVRTTWSEDTFLDCLGLCSALDNDMKTDYEGG